jgi:hypothetical protein
MNAECGMGNAECGTNGTGWIEKITILDTNTLTAARYVDGANRAKKPKVIRIFA